MTTRLISGLGFLLLAISLVSIATRKSFYSEAETGQILGVNETSQNIEESSSLQLLNPEEAKNLLKSDPEIILINLGQYPSLEVKNGQHLEIRLNQNNFEEDLISLDNKQKYLIFSANSEIAELAGQTMQIQGFQEIWVVNESLENI